MKVRQIIDMILGPSKKMVEREHEKYLLTKDIEQDQRERQIINARLRAIEISLPVAVRRNLRH